jgi:hypothetical protein
MISLQRKLAIKVRDDVYQAGNAPKHIAQGKTYPVIGYSVQVRKREKDGETESHEELSVFLVVNERLTVGYVYPSYCDIFIDPFVEEIVNAQFIKGEKIADEKGKAAATEPGPADRT